MKLLSVLGELSGSMGDITAARNKGGMYLRFRARPTNPQTPKQTAVRERLGGLSKRWSQFLTEAQRIAWKLLADTYSVVDVLGESRNLTGIAMFNKLNGVLLNAGESVVYDPPIGMDVSSTEALEITTAVGAATDCVLTFSPVLGATEVLYINGVVNISPAINNVKKLRRFFGVSAASALSPLTFDIPTEFGALVSGAKMSLMVNRLETTSGALSPGVVVEKIIT